MIMCLGFRNGGHWCFLPFFLFLLFSFDVWSSRWPLMADEMDDEMCVRVCVCVGLNFL
jgi:hypothetical protein